jgi:ATP-binding cassette subfamily B protein
MAAAAPTASLRHAPMLVREGLRLVGRSGVRLPIALGGLDLLGGALLAAELLIIREITNTFLEENAALSVNGLLAFAAVAAFRRVATTATGQLKVLAAERVEWSLVTDVMMTAAAAPFEEFENPAFHDRLRRALNAARNQVWNLVFSLLRLTNAGVASLSLTMVMVAVAPTLLVPFVVAGALLLGAMVVQTRLQYRFEFLDTQADRQRDYLREALISRVEGREARLFGSGQLLIQRHQGLQERRLTNLTSLIKRRLAIDVLGSLMLAVVLVGVFVAIAARARSGELAVADAAVAALTAHQLMGRLQAISSSLGGLHESTLFVADVTGFIAAASTPPDSAAAGSAPPDVSWPDLSQPAGGPAAIALADVSYTYPDAIGPALEHIDLRVEAGEIVALVGENGAGKSTVAKLFAGLYQPTSGAVQIERGDGDVVAVETVTSPLTGVVSAVFQEFARYELTVAENVWLGAPWLAKDESSTHESVRVAMGLAGADTILADLPRGLETRLGRRFDAGLDLSLGQWQRLALARAFFSTAPFLILDEPMAALDPRIEADLFDRLRELCQGRGVLLISHRYASLRRADRIVVIDEGRTAETGTHDELMELDSVYAHLYRLQANRYRDRDAVPASDLPQTGTPR